jgi:hypothetical protein
MPVGTATKLRNQSVAQQSDRDYYKTRSRCSYQTTARRLFWQGAIMSSLVVGHLKAENYLIHFPTLMTDPVLFQCFNSLLTSTTWIPWVNGTYTALPCRHRTKRGNTTNPHLSRIVHLLEISVQTFERCYNKYQGSRARPIEPLVWSKIRKDRPIDRQVRVYI